MPVDAAWSRLATKVKERRTILGLTQDAPGGPSKATWYKVENAIDPPYSTSTLRKVERVLGWMPNSVQRILDGGEPEEQWMPPPPSRVIRHEDGRTFDTIPMPDESTVTAQPRDERVLPPEWDKRLDDLQAEIRNLRDELVKEREELAAETMARQQLARRIEQIDAEPWLTIEPDPSNEDEMEIWGMERQEKVWRQFLIWEMRKGPDPDDEEDEAPRSGLAG